MKRKTLKYILMLLALVVTSSTHILAQCSVCARTSEQLDPTAAADFNFGVLYLMAAPLLIIATLSFLWYKKTQKKKF